MSLRFQGVARRRHLCRRRFSPARRRLRRRRESRRGRRARRESRWLVSSMGWGDRVASVTMLSAPNHGSRVADAVLAVAPGIAFPLLTPLLDLYGLIAGDPASEKDLRTSLEWLSEAYVDGVFNPAN